MNTIIKQYARNLRKNLTDAERALWKQLRCREIAGLKFRKQAPIGRYIVDFICYEANIIIEVDGSQHDDNKQYDEERTNWLNKRGFRVYRFWNNEVLLNMEGVKEIIWKACSDHPHPNPPPSRGRGPEITKLTL
jgi:very-short-patch-repair endonuclease